MASADRALAGLTRSDPVPVDAGGFVSYVGGKEQAWRALSGLPGKPQAGDYAGGKGSEQFRRDTTSWRNAQRWVQRHTAEEGKQRREGMRLAPEQRRAAQAANRAVKRADVERRGAAVTLTGRITAGRDSRVRTIGAGAPIILSPDRVQQIRDAVRDGASAADELWAALCDELGWDPGDDYFSVAGASWSAVAA